MPYVTWTFANRKVQPKPSGGYKSECRLHMNEKCYVVCPDNTFIEELNYQGDGRFNNQDIFELIVDWNRGHILETILKNHISSSLFRGIGQLLDNNWDDLIPEFVQNDVRKNGLPESLKSDWKHVLGERLAKCEIQVPYPIKVISTTHMARKYKDLQPSYIMVQLRQERR